MKKFVNILFVILIFTSLLASVSENLKQKARAFTKVDQYSSSLLRLPNKNKLVDKFASSKDSDKILTQDEDNDFNKNFNY